MSTYCLLARTPFEYDDGSEFHDVTYNNSEREFEAESDEQALKAVEQEAEKEIQLMGRRKKLIPIHLMRVVKVW